MSDATSLHRLQRVDRPAAPSALSNALVFGWRAVLKFRHVPEQLFDLIMTPLMFTGATQYPWPSLDSMPWFQVITALNPLTYCAEGVRAAMVPDVPHIAPWISILALLVSGAIFTATGMIGFRRRALD